MPPRSLREALALFCVLLAGCKQELPAPPPAEAATPAAIPSVSVEEFRKLRGQVFLLQRRIATLESSEATVRSGPTNLNSAISGNSGKFVLA